MGGLTVRWFRCVGFEGPGLKLPDLGLQVKLLLFRVWGFDPEGARFGLRNRVLVPAVRQEGEKVSATTRILRGQYGHRRTQERGSATLWSAVQDKGPGFTDRGPLIDS